MKKILFLFGALNDDDLDWIISTGHIERVSPGVNLIEEGELINDLYILLEGKVVVSVAVFDSYQEIAILESGEVFGEMSFVDSRLPSATVETLEDSLVLSIPRDHLATRLHQDIGFASRFYRAIALFLSSRLRMMLKERDYEREYLTLETVEKQDFPPAFLENLPFAEVRYDWLLRRIKNSQEDYQEIL
ncbi:cyclic nucleotide-binding domain-containing protein [Crocosphaera sp. XPORK-15E]|uniref:cyclic nucleotide-binding domain-containing protein n=1 Tax=Crocosphaera sp. XPORK-15E TaxID=3110247 RepID=UPI002B202D3F|nr:cyclic nucleotide-binding domain-containing protein [Crocosphaera sp. XPORK-15E]MEA5533190.1 cyclic nucleotide-binding domain-containing protein [Crocosphaera sp. XPORK-15E]